MSILYEKFKKYQVPASSVEDFRRRYTKPTALHSAARNIRPPSSRLPATILHSSAIPSSAATTA